MHTYIHRQTDRQIDTDRQRQKGKERERESEREERSLGLNELLKSQNPLSVTHLLQ